MNTLISVITEASPVAILMASQGVLTIAMGALYRDCKKDRERLWANVIELQQSRRKNG